MAHASRRKTVVPPQGARITPILIPFAAADISTPTGRHSQSHEPPAQRQKGKRKFEKVIFVKPSSPSDPKRRTAIRPSISPHQLNSPPSHQTPPLNSLNSFRFFSDALSHKNGAQRLCGGEWRPWLSHPLARSGSALTARR